MIEQKQCTTIQRECAKRFEHGAKAMSAAASKLDAVGEKVDAMHRVLLGNGDPAKGVAFRVASLETRASGLDKAKAGNISRLWELAVAVAAGGAMLMLGMLAKGG